LIKLEASVHSEVETFKADNQQKQQRNISLGKIQTVRQEARQEPKFFATSRLHQNQNTSPTTKTENLQQKEAASSN